MIPARLLTLVADQLVAETQSGNVHWQREKTDREHYVLPQGSLKFVLRYHPARVEPDVIEFAVLNPNGEEIGNLLVEDDKPELYDRLAELLFAVQRAEGRSGIRQVTDELIKLLPESERKRWLPQK